MAQAATPPLLTPIDLAAQLGVPIPTLYAWRTRGIGPRALKVGKHLRWRQADVDQWLEQQVPA
ncbi:helix-turn-helix domain-containing protein [Oerskovia sp. Sa1BUA8]|uniref:Helix-turn-helix domain-containing protein n=1 Tax=Oerskovia douganii TaxID=2762210 RepID=A0A9D5YY58_9CELL|nr:helix-turn-helix domain-containing protein [Oerskovia douganii]MBE7699236.1 helix-turn-helix domain-containing protein [Oerskovia douganii]